MQFEGYGSQEEVERSAVRERPQTAANEGPGYKGAALRRRAHAFWHLSLFAAADKRPSHTVAGVSAPNRRQVEADAEVQEMPAWLEFKPTGALARAVP